MVRFQAAHYSFFILCVRCKMFNLCAGACIRGETDKIQPFINQIWARVYGSVAYVAKGLICTGNIVAGTFAGAERIAQGYVDVAAKLGTCGL